MNKRNKYSAEFKTKAVLEIFSDGAIEEVYRYSSGAARLVNKVCTHYLLYGAQNHKRIIDDHMVKLVIQGEPI